MKNLYVMIGDDEWCIHAFYHDEGFCTRNRYSSILCDKFIEFQPTFLRYDVVSLDMLWNVNYNWNVDMNIFPFDVSWVYLSFQYQLFSLVLVQYLIYHIPSIWNVNKVFGLTSLWHMSRLFFKGFNDNTYSSFELMR